MNNINTRKITLHFFLQYYGSAGIPAQDIYPVWTSCNHGGFHWLCLINAYRRENQDKCPICRGNFLWVQQKKYLLLGDSDDDSAAGEWVPRDERISMTALIPEQIFVAADVKKSYQGVRIRGNVYYCRRYWIYPDQLRYEVGVPNANNSLMIANV